MMDIIEKLRDKGCRITAQRRLIVEKVAASRDPLTAGELWQRLLAESPGLGLDTVYRNLGILAEVGVLAPIAGAGKEGTRYELAASGDHHHHIVCLQCGRAACIDYCPVDPAFVALVRNRGYRLIKHNMELYGLCPACNSKGEAAKHV
ncbi:MAG TPA: Fur family transcriptional regulator [Selenomonadales bacterium]|nr:Fur family transcriptional regulator [Selenomonadales bacterium]